MVKIGVFGAGHLGKIHLKVAEASNILDLVGFYDPDPEVVKKIISEKKYVAYRNPEKLIAAALPALYGASPI